MSILYIASSIHMYDYKDYESVCKRISFRFPDLEMFYAKGKWSNSADWLEDWPKLLPKIEALVAIPDENNRFGRGVYKEWADVNALGKPCRVRRHRTGQLLKAELLANDPNNWRSYCTWREAW